MVAHQQLRDMGKQVEARWEERRNIWSDLEIVPSALYIRVGHGRFVIIMGAKYGNDRMLLDTGNDIKHV